MYGAFLRKQNIFHPTKRRKKILFSRKKRKLEKEKREGNSKQNIGHFMPIIITFMETRDRRKERKK